MGLLTLPQHQLHWSDVVVCLENLQLRLDDAGNATCARDRLTAGIALDREVRESTDMIKRWKSEVRAAEEALGRLRLSQEQDAKEIIHQQMHRFLACRHLWEAKRQASARILQKWWQKQCYGKQLERCMSEPISERSLRDALINLQELLKRSSQQDASLMPQIFYKSGQSLAAIEPLIDASRLSNRDTSGMKLHPGWKNIDNHSRILIRMVVARRRGNVTGNVLLHLACEGCHTQVVKRLLEPPFSLSAEAPLLDGRRPLESACYFGNAQVAELLLNHDAVVDAQGNCMLTPLMFALERGNIELVQTLVRHLPEGVPATNYTCCKNGEMLTLLLKLCGVGENDLTPSSGTGLELTKDKIVDLLQAVRPFLEARAPGRAQATALAVACAAGHMQAVQLLLKAQADTIQIASNGRSALHVATFYGHEKIVAHLIRARMSPTEAAADGTTPLHVACEIGNVRICRIMLSRSATNIHCTTCNGETPLDIAGRSGNQEIVHLLERIQTHNKLRRASSEKFVTPRVRAANLLAGFNILAAKADELLKKKLSSKENVNPEDADERFIAQSPSREDMNPEDSPARHKLAARESVGIVPTRLNMAVNDMGQADPECQEQPLWWDVKAVKAFGNSMQISWPGIRVQASFELPPRYTVIVKRLGDTQDDKDATLERWESHYAHHLLLTDYPAGALVKVEARIKTFHNLNKTLYGSWCEVHPSDVGRRYVRRTIPLRPTLNASRETGIQLNAGLKRTALSTPHIFNLYENVAIR